MMSERWKKTRDADEEGKWHAHMGYDALGADGTKLMFGDDGLTACLPNGEHWLMDYDTIIEGLPKVKK